MGTLPALVLGIVQGLTEFLPVSSTAHLYLAQALLGIPNDAVTLSFDVVLHLGTLLALLLVTWRLVGGLLCELALWLARRPPRDETSRRLLAPLIAGTVPGALAGLFLLKRFEAMRTPALVGSAMLVACAFFLLAERLGRSRFEENRDRSEIRLPDGVWMGIAQAAAGLMAGLSRSGLTISTGRARGLARDESARFSFLLAVPIILGAGAKSLLDLRKQPRGAVGSSELAAGFLAAAAVGYVAARFLLRFLRTHDLSPFAIYLGVLGLTLVALAIAGRDAALRSSEERRSSASLGQKLSSRGSRGIEPSSGVSAPLKHLNH